MLHEDTIPVSEDLQKLFAIPACAEISLPQVGELKLNLPNGATLKAIPDLSKGIPTDCSLATNLLLQLAPFLASIECLLKVLALLKPLIDVVNSLGPPPDPIKLPQAIADFGKAAADLLPCFGMIIPGPTIFLFIKDLLNIIIKIIKCMIGQLKTILGIMQDIGLRIEAAEQAGNTQLAEVLKCAQENATSAAQHAQASLGPVTNIMPLIASFLELAGVSFELPELGDPSDAEALAATIQTLEDTITTLESIIETLP
ncbi:hypothetical protein [Alteraurantiacibacter aquimixticola]|uniref:Uncharacterized protein n=1 Tax=Alteraurantiacibacter aquimixticola TaxID=2489173 RepID=A0A4V4U8D9_9SPHN|nr:hypothetical protein [Alteraurantiacibacter aquimixticola]TIX49630.1 hypothetical protein E5222_12430 [Alteraurantiacibacter aquimixticola]